MNRALTIFFLATGIFFSACTDEAPTPSNPSDIERGEGVIVLNEGQFGNGNASLSYFDFATGQTTNRLFEQANGRPLGDVLQSALLWKEELWLIVNASQKIEVVDMPSFQANDLIEGFTSPRFFLPIASNKAYVTDLYADAISIIDPETNTLKSTIPVSNWTEELARVDDKIFISAPWFFGSTPSKQILVIDANTDAVIDQIEVGVDPGAMVLDRNGKLWVFCKGDATATIFGGLYRIDPNTQMVEERFDFSDFDLTFASRMAVSPSGDRLYYLKGNGVFELSLDASALSTVPLIPAEGRSLYALGVNPQNGHLFVGDAVDFQQNGQVYEYDATGKEVQNFVAGVGPNGFLFY